LLSIELLFLLPTGGGRKAIISQWQGQGQTEARWKGKFFYLFTWRQRGRRLGGVKPTYLPTHLFVINSQHLLGVEYLSLTCKILSPLVSLKETLHVWKMTKIISCGYLFTYPCRVIHHGLDPSLQLSLATWSSLSQISISVMRIPRGNMSVQLNYWATDRNNVCIVFCNLLRVETSLKLDFVDYKSFMYGLS
jgi:hypothetical protein